MQQPFTDRLREMLEILAGERGDGTTKAVRANEFSTLLGKSFGLVPGALVEEGENANGRYKRIKGASKKGRGFQLCWANVTSLAGADKTWTFPAEFHNTAVSVTITPIVVGLAVAIPISRAPSATSVAWSVVDAAAARVAVPCMLSAVGEW